ncbi:MAG: hypothetical protein ACFCUQ_04795 [Kiloniellales bacterium]
MNDLPGEPGWLAQRYIAEPMLLNGRKFHLRLYLLVAGAAPPRLALWHDGVARLAVEPYRLDDLDRVEINEAFAAIALAVSRELGLPEDIVNVEGGAIAHGHPIGATGAILTTRLLHSMRRDGLQRGVVTLCIGGGQGIALALETLN